MILFAKIMIALVGVQHLYILWLEMFAWTTRARKVFKGYSPDFFEKSKTLAANQGLYNGFLSAGLGWSLLISDPQWFFNVGTFFLSCVAIAGIYGGVTAQRSIFYIQALPALLGLVLLLLTK